MTRYIIISILTIYSLFSVQTAYADEIMAQESHFDMMSDTGRTYRIFISRPSGTPPEKGWPVLWLIDGNMTYPLARRLHPNALLVGIGYPFEDRTRIVHERYYDLTHPARNDNFPVEPGQAIPATGGDEAFRRFLIEKLIPEILSQEKIDPTRQTLYGHSLGGLFVLYTFLRNRPSFNIYCAADPAIWWNRHEILQYFQEEKLPQELPIQTDKNTHTKVFISASGKRVSKPGLTDEAVKKIATIRGGANGKTVYEKLQNFLNILPSYKIYEQESHGSMIPFSVHDCLVASDLLPS